MVRQPANRSHSALHIVERRGEIYGQDPPSVNPIRILFYDLHISRTLAAGRGHGLTIRSRHGYTARKRLRSQRLYRSPRNAIPAPATTLETSNGYCASGGRARRFVTTFGGHGHHDHAGFAWLSSSKAEKSRVSGKAVHDLEVSHHESWCRYSGPPATP